MPDEQFAVEIWSSERVAWVRWGGPAFETRPEAWIKAKSIEDSGVTCRVVTVPALVVHEERWV